jgi:molybdopterin biosynthesis enzyme
MRPGKPTALAIVKNKPLLLLPGNPVAAMLAFEVFARPLILKMLGIKQEHRPSVKAKLTRKVASSLGMRCFLRVKLVKKKDEIYAEPIRIRGAGVLTTMTRADGYVIIPEDRDYLKKGEIVTVYLFR